MGNHQALSRSADFETVMREGAVTRGSGMIVYVRRGGSDAVRLGMAVRSTGATTRNRVKRRLRAALRAAEPQPGVDVMVKAGPGAAIVGFQELVTTFRRALAQGVR